jgi:hypothetical protein
LIFTEGAGNLADALRPSRGDVIRRSTQLQVCARTRVLQAARDNSAAEFRIKLAADEKSA